MYQGIVWTNHRIEDKDLTLQSQDGAVPSLPSDVSLEDPLSGSTPCPALHVLRPWTASKVTTSFLFTWFTLV